MTETKGIAQKVAKVMTAVRKLSKDGDNKFDNYKYITGDQAFEKLGGAMAEAGLVALPTIIEVTTDTVPTKSGSQYRTVIHGQITLADADSSDTWTSDWYGEGTDRGDKSINKAMTAMMKYYLLRLFQIGSGDDADADSPEEPHPRGTTSQAPRLEKPKPQPSPNVSRETVTAQHRQPSPTVSRETSKPQVTPGVPASDSDVDMGMGDGWEELPNREESDHQYCERAALIMHADDVELTDMATRLIAKCRELDKSSGDKALSIVKKDGTGSGQYGLLTGKLDRLTAPSKAHRFILSALCGRVISQENPPGWKCKELIDWLQDDNAAKANTEQALRDVWAAVRQVENVKVNA